MAKIAVDPTSLHDRVAQTNECGSQKSRSLAAGNGWSIDDLLCSAGPKDRAFEEQHSKTSIAVVLSGTFHFLRCFEDLIGTTPRQYVLRTRLRRAAMRLKQETTKVIEIALDCGFGDVSNFNHAFRAEFGQSPRSYRSI